MIRAYALLARLLLPRSFLREFGAEMEADVAARLGAARGWRSRCGHFYLEVLDLMRTGLRERLAERSEKRTRKRAALARKAEADVQQQSTLDAVRLDIRYALRQMRRAPGFSLVVILTLAIGIGLNTAVFSAVHALLLRPLTGVADQHRLVRLYRTWPGIDHGANSIPHYFDLSERGAAIFEGVAAWSGVAVSLSTGDATEIAQAQMVSANFFDVLGTKAALGRTFLPEEAEPIGAHPVVVLSHELWRTRFGGDPAVLGRTVRVNGEVFEIIGVASEGFRGATHLSAPALWAPLSMQPVLQPGRSDRIENRNSNFMSVIARMKSGATLPGTRAAVLTLFEGLRREYPGVYDRSGITLIPLERAGLRVAYGDTPQRYATLLLAVVGVLLLLACANVASMLLARSERRRREIAIRVSIGAGRARLVRQLLTESLVFAAAAGSVGLAFAFVAIRVLESVPLPTDLPLQVDLMLSTPVLLFALIVALGTALLSGLVPALQGTSAGSAEGLGRGASAHARSRMTSALVVVQTSLAVVLLVSAAIFLRSLMAATRIDVGFEATHLLSARVHPDLAGRDRAATESFTRTLAERLTAQPGVVGVTWVDILPLDASSQTTRVAVPGYVPGPGEQMSLDFARVGPGYFETMGIPIMRGRGIGAADDSDAVGVVVVNETMAARFWPSEDPIGRIVETQGRERVVVGVAGSGKYGSLGEAPIPFMYLALAQDFRPAVHVIVRAAADPATLAPLVRRTVRDIDRAIPLREVWTMENHLDASLLPSRLATGALGLFGVLGLLLSTLGLYGVVAQSVSRQTRDIGIRLALGARPARILGSVLARGARLTILGLAAGVVLAFAVARAMRGLIYTTPIDPLAFALVPVLLASFSLFATWLPARRASRIDPVRAVKME